MQLSPSELSSAFGYMSIACWLIVYSPQIYTNYATKSGEGLSVAFIVIWLAGDLTNLVGGVMAGLLPTMIILAVYYSLCDIILLIQVYYYRALRRRAESQPLLVAPATSTAAVISPYIAYPLMLIFVIAFGFIGLEVSGPDEPTQPGGPAGGVELEWKSQLLGYASCLLYLGSRVPQIFHNFSTRCEGLSLAMFFFSITGNVTYVVSILAKSLDHQYLLANLSWIAGAGLTVFLDLFVLAQFAVYSWQDRHTGKVFLDEESDSDYN